MTTSQLPDYRLVAALASFKVVPTLFVEVHDVYPSIGALLFNIYGETLL